MDRSVDRLAVVSRIMLDQRFLELRAENETLRSEIRHLNLSLFWCRYSPDNMKARMIFGNFWNAETGPKCTCLACKELKRLRYYHVVDPTIETCRFKPWVDQLVRDCGLTVKYIFYDRPVIERECYDTHIIVYFKDNWDLFTYGHKLRAATSVDDPELRKLEQLYRVLGGPSITAVSEGNAG